MTQAKSRRKVVKALAKGQITIPTEFRRALGIEAETLLSISLVEDHLEVSPLRNEEATLRRYTQEDISTFLEEDKLDEETAQRVRELLETRTLDVCRGTRFRAAISVKVLLEARVNIARKFGEQELLRFYEQIAAMDPKMVPPPSQQGVSECEPLVTDKDAHVLAAALECRADYLLTLDRRHLLTPAVLSSGLPLSVMTPGDFLKELVANNPSDNFP